MSGKMNEKVGDAYKLYKSGLKLVDIADKLNIPQGTIRRWKSIYKWESKQNERSEIETNENKTNNTNNNKKLSDIVEENKELTEKQKLFCLFYVNNFNATLSAIKAGYSKKTATVIGYENLGKPYIRAEINKLKEIKKQALLVDENDIVERYMKIAFSDMTDFVGFGTEEVAGKKGKYKKNILYFKNDEMVDGAIINEISVGINGAKIKLEDKLKALNWLGEYFNTNPMNKHKIKYDNRKLELEEKKQKSEESGIADAWIKALEETE